MLFHKKYRVVIMVSGRGSNMEAIIRAVKNKSLKNIEIAKVISDNPEAKALDIARGYGVPAEYIYPGPYKTKLEGQEELDYIASIRKAKPHLIVMAGFMRIIKPGLIRSFPNRIINIHPSLLPKYPGLHTHARALEAGDKEAGCTVHFVNEVTDGGKRIMQAKVMILPVDDEESLARRVLEKEHEMLSLVISLLAEGKIKYETLPDEPLLLGEQRR